MKTLSLISIFLLISLVSFPQGALEPTVKLNELYFESDNSWVIELLSYDLDQDLSPIENVKLITNRDTLFLSDSLVLESDGYKIIRQKDLDTDFFIDKNGDSLILKYHPYACVNEAYEELVFGNMSNSVIDSPKPGQSISKYIYYVKDASPTIGKTNDTTGILGTLKGKIYDMYGNPIANKEFWLESYKFTTTEDGSYNTRMFSRPTELQELFYSLSASRYTSVVFEKINYTMEPDSVIIRNIYLLNSLMTDINRLNTSKKKITYYPNPIKEGVTLNYQLDFSLVNKNARIEIIDINSKIIAVKHIETVKGELDISEFSGLIIVNLIVDEEIINSEKIIVTD